MAALPYMRLYWSDYEADTAHLTTFEHGIYLMLIKNYWQRGGPLPGDDARLAKIARVSMRDWRNHGDTIREFFTVRENTLYHSRISQELARVEAKSLNNKRPGNTNAKRTRNERVANETRSSIYTDTDTDEISNDISTPPTKLATGWDQPPCPVEKQIWADFKTNRKRKRLSNTPTAYERLRYDLAKVSAETGISQPSLLEAAAAKGWGGIYDPTEQKNGAQSNPSKIRETLNILSRGKHDYQR